MLMPVSQSHDHCMEDLFVWMDTTLRRLYLQQTISPGHYEAKMEGVNIYANLSSLEEGQDKNAIGVIPILLSGLHS